MFVSHNMAAVRRLCRRGILLEDGQVKFEIVRRQYERREYSFYYRDGDDIYRINMLEEQNK